MGVPYTIVIPARYASSRFPGKMLAPLLGRPMILHTLERAAASSADEVIVATDDDRIADVCRRAGARVEMTRTSHPSGTDRIAEVAGRLGWPADRAIVGLQGDEPATPPERLDALAAQLAGHADADVATLCRAIGDEAEYSSAARVKVVRDARGMALYFSRAPIPWRRDPQAGSAHPESWLHIGLYAYRAGFLPRYTAMSACALEDEEKLEQLRVLYHGGRIHVTSVEGTDGQGVDHPDDVAAVERELRERFPSDHRAGPLCSGLHPIRTSSR